MAAGHWLAQYPAQIGSALVTGGVVIGACAIMLTTNPAKCDGGEWIQHEDQKVCVMIQEASATPPGTELIATK